METLQRVRQAVTPLSEEEKFKIIKSALKVLGGIALVAMLLIGIVWTSYTSGVSRGEMNAAEGAKVTSYQKWEIPVTNSATDKTTSTSTADATSTHNFPPSRPGDVAPRPIGIADPVGSVTKLVTLSKAPSVTMTFGATGVHVLVALSADQWRELLAQSGDANLEKVGVACLKVSEACATAESPFGSSDTPSSVGLSVETVKHLAQPYVSQLNAEQATNIGWEVTVELFTP